MLIGVLAAMALITFWAWCVNIVLLRSDITIEEPVSFDVGGVTRTLPHIHAGQREVLFLVGRTHGDRGLVVTVGQGAASRRVTDGCFYPMSTDSYELWLRDTTSEGRGVASRNHCERVDWKRRLRNLEPYTAPAWW